jgi:hypothetical protein
MEKKIFRAVYTVVNITKTNKSVLTIKRSKQKQIIRKKKVTIIT